MYPLLSASPSTVNAIQCFPVGLIGSLSCTIMSCLGDCIRRTPHYANPVLSSEAIVRSSQNELLAALLGDSRTSCLLDNYFGQAMATQPDVVCSTWFNLVL